MTHIIIGHIDEVGSVLFFYPISRSFLPWAVEKLAVKLLDW